MFLLGYDIGSSSVKASLVLSLIHICVLVAVWVLVVGILIIYTVMKKKLISVAAKSVIQDSIPAVMNLRFGDIATLLANRVSSVLLLVSSVFMKHLRRMDYRSIYRDDDWKNRCMMNGVYELRPDEAWASKLKSGQLPEYLKPSNKIQQHSTTVSYTHLQRIRYKGIA